MQRDMVLIDKPAGWTSFDVVAKIRSAIRAAYRDQGIQPTKRQLKVGHTGTLDPFATGLLVILLGDACSQTNDFLKLDKVYEATIELGKISTTGDPEGELQEIERTENREIVREDIERALMKLTGEIEQTPPAYSAIKIGGKRAYELARQGKKVVVPARRVTIFSVTCTNYAYPFVAIRAHVSSGTYIRTLAEDIGKLLGTGAYCTQLRRTKIGTLQIEDAETLDRFLANRQFNEQEE